ncbi:hypothetical protein CFOL_v3_28114, partial [Cephalotus follicularis]
FRLYKDTFLTKVFTREDVNQPYWKVKNFTGLQQLFAEKIESKYREQYNRIVPYDTLTYGDIFSIITKTGLELCNDIKINKQIKRDAKTYKKELGDVCTQFGYEQLKPPFSTIKNNPQNYKSKYRKIYYKRRKQIETPQ